MRRSAACFLAAAVLAGAPGGAGASAEPILIPPPPAVPRYRWVGAIRDNARFQKRTGWWRRLVGAVAGRPEPAALVRPYGLVADGRRLLVCDPGAGRVHVFDLRDSTYAAIPRDGRIDSPIDAAVVGDVVYVTSSRRAVVRRFTLDGADRGALDGPFSRPTGIAWHPGARRLYVVDTIEHTVFVHDADGRRIGRIGGRGVEPGRFNFPTAVAAADSSIYVTDAMNFRVQRFALDGAFLGAFGKAGDSSGDFAKPKGVAVDGDGNVYVADALFDVVQVFRPDGRLLLVLGGAGGAPARFRMPTGLCTDGDDRLYVADSRNRRVQVFQYLKR